MIAKLGPTTVAQSQVSRLCTIMRQGRHSHLQLNEATRVWALSRGGRTAAWAEAGQSGVPLVNGGRKLTPWRQVKIDPLGWSWFVGGGRGDAAEVAVFEPVAVAFEGDDFGVVDEAVDHGGGDDVVAEDLAPAAERLVAGDDQAGPFVAGGDELEEQVGGFGFEGDVADLVDDEQRVAAEPDELGLQPAGGVGVGEAGDPLRRRWRTATRWPAWQARIPRPMARWVLPVPGGPRNTTFSLAVTKSRVPRWAIVSRLRDALRGRSRTPPGSCGPGTGRRGCGPRRRGTRGRRPRVAGRRPGTPRGVQPSARARSASRSTDVAQGRRLQRPGEVRELGGQVARWCWSWSWRPSRDLPRRPRPKAVS